MRSSNNIDNDNNNKNTKHNSNLKIIVYIIKTMKFYSNIIKTHQKYIYTDVYYLNIYINFTDTYILCFYTMYH